MLVTRPILQGGVRTQSARCSAKLVLTAQRMQAVTLTLILSSPDRTHMQMKRVALAKKRANAAAVLCGVAKGVVQRNLLMEQQGSARVLQGGIRGRLASQSMEHLFEAERQRMDHSVRILQV